MSELPPNTQTRPEKEKSKEFTPEALTDRFLKWLDDYPGQLAPGDFQCAFDEILPDLLDEKTNPELYDYLMQEHLFDLPGITITFMGIPIVDYEWDEENNISFDPPLVIGPLAKPSWNPEFTSRITQAINKLFNQLKEKRLI